MRSNKGGRLRRGIYLLPTLFTVGNLFCGYWAMVLTIRGDFKVAGILIIVAAALDGMDGRIARLTGTTSPFGLEFDSLADMVSFGVAPALLGYHWALAPLGRTGWMISFLFAVCVAMRLARFNIQTSMGDKRFFAGLPCPSAGAMLACVAFAFPEQVDNRMVSILVAALVCGLGLLMISRLRYYSFKDFDLRSRRSYIYVLPLAAVIVSISVWPREAMLLFGTAYIVSAPTYYLWSLLTRKRTRNSEVADEPALR
jgi:CDP-diacylglycerol--serine O-phosphatidyltransferase